MKFTLEEKLKIAKLHVDDSNGILARNGFF